MDRLLADPRAEELLATHPRGHVVDALREAVDDVRVGLGRAAADRVADPADPGPYLAAAAARLARDAEPALRPVMNATGVVLHTNLGRAPLAPEARDAMAAAGRGYTALEFDLETGGRGSRYVHCAGLLRSLTGAEDALVVNNCAAALVLAVHTFALGRGVVVSRGELVEIGGGFRIPDMLERAGARMVEVGTTNRTRLEDYRRALDEGGPIGAILKVHRSNFRMRGFTEEVELADLASLAADADVPLVHDLGSGLLVEPERVGLPPEPRPSDSVRAEADLVVFSGDKLLGGPQAGLMVGRTERVAAARRNPLCRALRVDKGTLAALEATLRLYGDPETVLERVPVLRMLAETPERLGERARRVAAALEGAPGIESTEVTDGVGRVGGGTYPEHPLPTRLLRLSTVRGAEETAARLRGGAPPVIARVEDDRTVLDLRTIDPAADDALADLVRRAVAP